MVSENEKGDRVKSTGEKRGEKRSLSEWENEDEIYWLNDSGGKSEVGELQLSFDGVNGLNVCFLVEISRERGRERERTRERERERTESFSAGGGSTGN